LHEVQMRRPRVAGKFICTWPRPAFGTWAKRKCPSLPKTKRHWKNWS